MLTSAGCLVRRQNLREQFKSCDLLLVSQPPHLHYLSGFITNATELAGGGLNFLLIDRRGHSQLLADNWASTAAQAAFVDGVTIWNWYDFSTPAEERFGAAAQALADLLARHYRGVKQVAIDRSQLPAAAWQALGPVETIDMTEALGLMRRTKAPDELTAIRRAIRAAEAGQAAARRSIRAGVTELDVYADVQAAITLAAGEPIVLLADLAAGKRSEAAGGPPTRNRLNQGDLLILDLFPLIGGYRADITNTFCVGDPTLAQLDHIEKLQAALRAGEEMLRPGVTGAQVFEACRRPLVEAGIEGVFSHHAGHGFGLGHPEPPYLVPGSQEVLQAGNIVTLEPGVYRPGWGGARVEHDYVITEQGFERLSHHKIGL